MPAPNFNTVTGKSNAELSVQEILGFFTRRWPWLLGGLGAGVVVAAMFLMFKTPYYESTATVLVERKDSRLASQGVEGVNEINSKVTEDLLATHMRLLQSPVIVSTALRHGKLEELPSIRKRQKSDEKPVDVVIRSLVVTHGGQGQARGSSVLNVSVQHTDPEDAKRIVEEIILSYKAFLAEKYADKNSKAADLITEAWKDIGKQLSGAQESYEQFRQKSPELMWNNSGSGPSNIHRLRYEGIQQEISDLRLRSADIQARLDAVQQTVEERGEENMSDFERLALIDEKNLTRVSLLVQFERSEAETTGFQAAQPQRLEQARIEFEKLLELEMKEKRLQQEYGKSHPEVIALSKEIRHMKQFLAGKEKTLDSAKGKEFELNAKSLFDSYIRLLKNDLEAAKRRERSLTELSDKEEELARGLVSIELTAETLRKDVERKQSLYDAIVDRLRDIKLATEYGGFLNEVIAEPEVGELISPTPILAMGWGLLVSLMVGFGSAGLVEFRDRRFRSAEDIQRLLKLPIFSQIPAIQMADKSMMGELGLKSEGPSAAQALCTVYGPETREAEAFRSLRAALLFGGLPSGARVIAITSPEQGDGKSTLVGNLAVALSQVGRSVVLVDCDLRRPSQHHLFDIDNSKGLTDLLTDGYAPSELIHQPVHAPGLSILPAGQVPPNPAELLTSAKLKEAIEDLRQKYDFVLLDCPPVMPVADPRIIAASADCALLIVNAENNSQQTALLAKTQLEQNNINVIGTIVNVPKMGAFGSGYEYYQYQYSYKADGTKTRVPKRGTNGQAVGVAVANRMAGNSKN